LSVVTIVRGVHSRVSEAITVHDKMHITNIV
jgi:hypothetical protein